MPKENRPGLNLFLVVIVRHFESRPLKATLNVKALIGLAAVKDRLVAANLVGNEIECLDQPKTQFFPLLVLRNRNVFDMGDRSEAMNADDRLVLAIRLRCAERKNKRLHMFATLDRLKHIL